MTEILGFLAELLPPVHGENGAIVIQAVMAAVLSSSARPPPRYY